jgi:ribonuclease D
LLSNLSDYAAATAEIKAAAVVGFDTESKPTFVTGDQSTGPHLVQFALPDKAFLFQPQRADGLPFLLDLLQSPEVIKVGFGLKSDRKQIHATLGIQLHATIDLNSLFSRQGYRKDLGVRAAVGLMFNQRFIKSRKVTTSNWSQSQLSPQQLLYAANDAYAALKVMRALNLPSENLAELFLPTV